MRYEISGTVMQTVAVDLDPGEIVYSQTNCMCWMNDAIEMNTNTGGGFFAGLKRSFSGGSLFVTDFTARGNGHVAFAPRFPGTILAVPLAPGQSLICRKETFLCAEKSVAFEIAWQKRIGAGFFGGQGFILQKVTGPGTVFLDLAGEVVERDLAPGERLLVHAGHVGVMDPTIQFDIQLVPRLQEYPVRRRGPVPRDADRPRPRGVAEHADHEPCRGTGALHAEPGRHDVAVGHVSGPPCRQPWRAAFSAASWVGRAATVVTAPEGAAPSRGSQIGG